MEGRRKKYLTPALGQEWEEGNVCFSGCILRMVFHVASNDKNVTIFLCFDSGLVIQTTFFDLLAVVGRAFKLYFINDIFSQVNFHFFYRMKVQAVEDMQELYHHKHRRLQVRDLMRLTWTTKRRWFPNVTHNRKMAAKDSPRERPFM